MTLTDAQLLEARRLAEEATPGPWKDGAIGTEHGYLRGIVCLGPDAKFVCEARRTMPLLLDDLAAARAENERLKHDYESLAAAYRSLPELLERLERDRATKAGR